MGFEDWSNNKKKKKNPSSFEEWSNANRGISKAQEEEDERKRQAYLSRNKSDDDIAPVGGNKDSWFKSGGFSDGVDGVGDFFGDLGETIGGTVGDLGLGIVKGAGRMVEGLVDLGTYGVAGVADAFGADDFAEKTRKVARYSATDEWTKPATDFLDKYSVLGNKADMVSEGLGQIGAIILTGGAAGAAGLSGAGVAAVTTGATGLSAMGSGMGTAYEEGATDEEAFLYGLGAGAIEAGTELAFGGLGKAVKALGISRGIGGFDDIFAKKLSGALTKAITNESVQKIAGNTIEAAVKAGGEGLEEMMSGFGSAVMKKLTYEDDESLQKLIEDENLLEQFVVGAITSSIAQGADFVKANKSGTDFVTGLTTADEKVVNRVVEDEIAEREKNGGKLSLKEKNAIYDSVVDRMEKGQIDIDTIESTLGGESYKAYTDAVESEEKLKAELDELSNIKAGDLTRNQQKRLEELEGMNLSDTSKRDGLRKNLDDALSPMLKGSKLTESYRERERRGQAFEADLNKYTGKQREAVERAVKSGVLNNTYRSHELVDVLSKIEAAKGISFDYTNNAKLAESGFAVEGKTVNGFANKKTGSVTLNVQSSKAWQSVVGHEITHVLEGTEAYGTLRAALYEYAHSKGDLDSRRKALTELYHSVDAETDIDSELTADLVGDYLFTDRDFINHLTGNRTLFQKVYDEIKYLWNVATGKEKTEIERVKDEFDRAWTEYSAENIGDERSVEVSDVGAGNVQYSISPEADADYMSAVERGDTETAQRMVDEAAKNAGYTRKLYHGTASKFNVFGFGRTGIFTTDNFDMAKTYGDNVMSLYGKEGAKVLRIDAKESPHWSIEVSKDVLDFSEYPLMRGKDRYSTNDISLIAFREGYDVVVIDNVYDNYSAASGNTENGLGTDVVYKEPNQVKSSEAIIYDDNDNVIPLSERFNEKSKDIRFSLSESVEETKDLMALHNLQSSELAKTLELGGLPMPSIAVIKDTMSHEQYGDVSLILPKEAIDPAANKDNNVYGGDAWTPTYPKIEYKPNEKVAKKISDKYYGLAKVIGYDEIRPMYRYVNELEDALNRDGGEAAMLEKLYDDTDMMNLYLQDSGKGKVEPITRETVTKISDAQAEMNQWFIDALGEDFIASFKAPEGVIPMKHRSAFMEQNEEKIRDTYKRYFAEEYGFTAEEIENVFENIGKRDLMTIMRDAYLYMQNKGVTVRTETDSAATNDAIREAASDGYKEWVDGLFKGIEEKSGIRNNQDYYTRSGNPRSWDALHWENTLENVVKVMKGQDETGVGSFSPFNTLFGSSHKRYGSIQEIKADSGRLGVINQDDYDAMKDSFSERFAAIASSIKDPDERNPFIATDTAAEQIIEAVRTKKTKTGILNHLKALNSRANMQTVDEVLSLVSDIANMPTGYFEAKPQRAVGLEEVGVFVIPRNADVKLKQELLNRGYSIAEYDPDVEGDRQRVVNQFEEYKFSLSNVGEESAPIGNYSTPFRELALERDIAPVSTDTPTAEANTPTVQADTPTDNGDLFPEGYAPMTEEEADALSKARYEAITDADAPPEMDAPYYGEEDAPVDPFESRDMQEVGSQKVKAYMYENPEVKPFFQQEAEVMLGDLYRTTRGERVVDADVLYETGGEAGVWGVKRHTAPDIAELKDKWGYTYDEIEAGIKAIIEDNGKENNACSKRIEFMLNDRLMNGYQDFEFGLEIPENREYIRLVKEKGIIEYNEEARKHFFDDIESYIPPAEVEEDIAPVRKTAEKTIGGEQIAMSEEFQPESSEKTSLEKRYERIDRQLEADKAALAEEFARRKAEAQAALADKNSFYSSKAFDLYNEVRSMQKGVRVSEELGYLLDHLDLSPENKSESYNKLRTALLNIRNRPGSVVNQNSAIEAVAREMLNASYESAVYDLDDMDSQYQQELDKLEADAKEQKATARKREEALTRSALHGNIINDVKATFDSAGYNFDDVLKKAKNLSTLATVDNTPQRVMEKALGYKEGGVLADLTVNRVAQNESAGIKWLNSFTDRKNGLLAQLSKKYRIKPGSKESAAAQMYAEGFYVDEYNDIIKYGDEELALDFPNKDVQKRIKGLAHDPRIRQIYDETLEAINASRTRNAYPEIQRLNNYFLHFRAMDDTFSRLGLPFNPNDIKAKDLPTDLNGVTADLKPGQPYFASAKHRLGKRTSFDLLGGLERYLTSAKNQIYHIDDIQTLRALRNYIADTYGQANGLEGIDLLTEEEVQEQIEAVYGSHLSTFAKFLNEEANVLAGKTALIDRGLEGVIGRRGMTFLDSLNKQVGSNMVGFNISSSLTNFLPVAQTFAKTNKFDFTKAFAQTVSNKISSIFGLNDGFAESSPVVIRRKGADRFYRTPWQKAGDMGYVLMSAVDDISTELIARTKYNELKRKGMDEQAAHIETDKWVSRLMGDRSLGQQPQLYNSKTLGIFTKFQLEVRNQLDSQFYDTIQEAKVSAEDIENRLARNAKIAAKVTSTFVQLAVVQHLYGKAFESVAGYNPAFDIIEVLMTAFGFDDEENSEDTALDNIEQGFLALLEDLPYTSTFTGGRMPLENALPIEQVIKGEDQYGNEKSRLETIREAAPYYVLPGGYGQIKKTAQGLNMFSDEHPVSGSYTNSGNLRFPVEDTPLNRAQAAVFGQYASENAREYFDNGYAPLKEKQIQEYIDVDIPIKDYWKYRKGLAKQDKLEDKLDYISGLDLPVSKKNILANNVTDRKEPIDLTNYDDFGSLEEFDFATKQPEKYAFAKSVGGYSAYKRYSGELGDIKSDKDANGKTINGSRKEKVIEYINNLDADYYTKIILLKSEYPSEDGYNSEIIEYLNGRNDITYKEQVAILTELGFRVTADGQIYAD